MGTQNEREGKFLSHQPCPRCRSKDNLAVYSDGHSYCFGCYYYLPPSSYNNRTLSYKHSPTLLLDLPPDCTHILPLQCNQWLKQYGLTNDEISDLEVMWSDSTGLLVFPMWSSDEGVTTIIGYIGRRFTGTGSKYIIRGEKSKFTKIYGSGTSLIFTEDLISAVKVGRVQSALPLFGTHLKTLPNGYSKYYLWLDKDKQRSSVEQCRKWKQYGYNITPIITDLDPKEYNTAQLNEII